MSRLLNLAVLGSQFLNVVIFNGSPDETVSGRAYRLRHNCAWSIGRHIIDTIFFWTQDHCAKSHAKDVVFARMILEETSADV